MKCRDGLYSSSGPWIRIWFFLPDPGPVLEKARIQIQFLWGSDLVHVSHLDNFYHQWKLKRKDKSCFYIRTDLDLLFVTPEGWIGIQYFLGSDPDLANLHPDPQPQLWCHQTTDKRSIYFGDRSALEFLDESYLLKYQKRVHSHQKLV